MSSTLLLLGQGIVAVTLLAAAGNWAVCLSASLRTRPWYSRWAYAYLLGIVFVCGSLFAASQWLSLPIRPAPIGSLIAVLALCGIGAEAFRFRIRKGTDEPLRDPALPRWIGLLLTLAILIPAAAVLVDSAIDPNRGIDGRNTWIPKARYIRQAGTVLPEVLQNRRWVVAHPRYPPLLPLAQVVSLEVTRGNDERVIRTVYAAFWLVWVLIILDQSRALAEGRAASLVLALAACIPFVAFAFDGGAAGAYSDLPLACFWGAGLLLLLGVSDQRGSALLAGLLLSGAVLTKNEGLGLAVMALVGGLVLCLGRKKALLRWSLSLIPFLLTLALLRSWKSAIPNRRDESYFARLSLESISDGLMRLWTEGLPVALDQMMDVRWWSLLWIALPLLLLFGAKGLKEKRAAVICLMVAGGLAQFLVAYSITGWNLNDLVRVTWNRALLQVSVPLLVLGALAARSVPWRDSLAYRLFFRSPRSGGRAAIWVDLLALAILTHLTAGYEAMMESSFDLFEGASENSGQSYSEAQERLWGVYARGLDTIRAQIPGSGSYFLANPTGSTGWIVTVGDLAPRKAHFVKDLERFRARWEKGGRARELKWTVVFRGLDKDPIVVPTAQYLHSTEALNPDG